MILRRLLKSIYSVNGSKDGKVFCLKFINMTETFHSTFFSTWRHSCNLLYFMQQDCRSVQSIYLSIEKALGLMLRCLKKYIKQTENLFVLKGNLLNLWNVLTVLCQEVTFKISYNCHLFVMNTINCRFIWNTRAWPWHSAISRQNVLS